MTCMKRRRRPSAGFLLPLLLTAAALSAGAAKQQPSSPPARARSEQYLLDNGLRVCLVENRAWPLVHVVVGVDLGSKNETAETNGLSHILEHYVLFRGTYSRTADQVSRDIRQHGAYLNAHTGLDIAQFELTLPSGQDEFALSNQRDILFNLKIDRDALEAEKEVILEELNQQEDDPFRYATSLVYQKLFAGHPYAQPIAGTRESISQLTVAQMESFYKTFFTTANAVLVVVGDFSLPDMKDKVARIFGPLPRAEAPPGRNVPAPAPRDSQEITLARDVGQATCVIGLVGPDYNHPDQYAVDLLTEIMGRGVNPLLNSALSRRRVQAEGLSMAYYAHRYGGVILITLTLDPRALPAAQSEALSFLRKARTLNFSADESLGYERFFAFDYLKSAKNQVRFLSEKSQEFGLNLAISLARHMILSNGAAGDGYLESIGRITSSDLRRAAAKYFSAGKAVTIRVLPSAKERR